MELNVYDTNIIPLGVIDEIGTLIWTRRYWSCGDFKLCVPFKEKHRDLLQKHRLIMMRGGNEAAQILYVHISKNELGQEQIEAQGKMLPLLLDKRIVLSQVIAKDNTQNIIYRLVRENLTAPKEAARIIPRLSIMQSGDLGSGQIDYTSEPYLSVLLACEDAAKAAKLGFRVLTDERAGQHYFEVYKGRELTDDQTALPPCLFSQQFDNILDQEYTNSIENLRTVGFVGGEEKEGVPRMVEQIGTASGLDRDEVFINASDINQTYQENGTEITLTDAQYRAQLKQRGIQEMEYHTETLSFASKINLNSNLVYRVDFDLGDRVTCLDKRWGIKINVRITEIEETYQDGQMDVDVTFGESLPTLFEQIRKAG